MPRRTERSDSELGNRNDGFEHQAGDLQNLFQRHPILVCLSPVQQKGRRALQPPDNDRDRLPDMPGTELPEKEIQGDD